VVKYKGHAVVCVAEGAGQVRPAAMLHPPTCVVAERVASLPFSWVFLSALHSHCTSWLPLWPPPESFCPYPLAWSYAIVSLLRQPGVLATWQHHSRLLIFNCPHHTHRTCWKTGSPWGLTRVGTPFSRTLACSSRVNSRSTTTSRWVRAWPCWQQHSFW
jgi:hypothetical protein